MIHSTKKKLQIEYPKNIIITIIVTSHILMILFKKEPSSASAHHDVEMLCPEQADHPRSFRPSDSTFEATANGQPPSRPIPNGMRPFCAPILTPSH